MGESRYLLGEKLVKPWAMEPEILDYNPVITTDQLCDLGLVTYSLGFLIKTQEYNSLYFLLNFAVDLKLL